MLLILVILSTLKVWFYASLTNTSKVGTVTSFLQVKRLRRRVGVCTDLFEVTWLHNDGLAVGLLSPCFNYSLYVARLKLLHEFRKERFEMLGGFTGE